MEILATETASPATRRAFFMFSVPIYSLPSLIWVSATLESGDFHAETYVGPQS